VSWQIKHARFFYAACSLQPLLWSCYSYFEVEGLILKFDGQETWICTAC